VKVDQVPIVMAKCLDQLIKKAIELLKIVSFMKDIIKLAILLNIDFLNKKKEEELLVNQQLEQL
jgi:hypothetical protein